jgi:uroporphyrinogen-III synthase
MPSAAPLSGLKVANFESRMSSEASRFIERLGGEPIAAPSVREVPLPDSPGLLDLLERLQRGGELVLVLLTGVGTSFMIDGLSRHLARERVLALLAASSTRLVCRGPKPHAVLKRAGITPAVIVGEPNTWRDVLRDLEVGGWVQGRPVFVQEYGRTNDELIAGLHGLGATAVTLIKTYAWALPEDTTPLRRAIERIAAGEVDAALFTSAVQVTHLISVAEELELLAELRAGLQRCVIASVGPITSEALRASGFEPDLEPEHPKLGQLMNTLGQQIAEKLPKRRSAPPLAP